MPHARRPPRFESLRESEGRHTKNHEHEKIGKKSTGERLTANGEPLQWLAGRFFSLQAGTNEVIKVKTQVPDWTRLQ